MGFAPHIRIGVHAAQATRRGGDFFGQGVHLAARVAAAGGAAEILTTASTLSSSGERYPVCETEPLALKGVAEPVEVVKIDRRR